MRQQAHATHSVKREDEIRYWYHRTPRARLDLRVDGERVVLARCGLGVDGGRSPRRRAATTAKLVIASSLAPISVPSRVAGSTLVVFRRGIARG